MCTPSDNTCRCKDRCIQFLWQPEHAIYETAVKIYVGIDSFVNFSLLTDYFWCQFFHQCIKSILLLTMLFSCQLCNKCAEDICPWIGNRIDRMSHSINQTFLIECFLIQECFQICLHFISIFPVCKMLLHIFKHLCHFDISASMLWPFQRCHSSCHR